MSATTVGCRCTSKRKCPWTSCTPRAPSPSPSSAHSAACGKCSRCDSRPDSPRARPPSHPGRVLLPSRVLPQPRFNVGAPPTVRKRSQTPTTEPAPFVPGAGTVRGPAPALVYVGAPPTVRKRSQTPTTEPAPFAPGAGTVRGPAPALVYVGAPPSVRKRSQTTTPEPAPIRTRGGCSYRPASCASPVSCRSTAVGAKAESNHNPRAYTLRTRGGCSYNKLVEVLGGVPFGHLFVQLAPGTVDLAAALYRGPYGDLLGPVHEVGIALGIEELGGAVHLVGHYAAIPGPDSHIGNTVLLTRHIAMPGQLPIEHIELALDLHGVAVDRVLELLRCVGIEMTEATTEQRSAPHLPEQPIQALGAPGHVLGNELTELLRQVQQDGAGLEQPQRRVDAGIQHGRDLRVGVDLDKAATELVTLVDTDQPGIVLGLADAQLQQLLEHDGDLDAVGRGQRIQLQRLLAARQLTVVGRAGNRAVDAGELAAIFLIPGPDSGWGVSVLGHHILPWWFRLQTVSRRQRHEGILPSARRSLPAQHCRCSGVQPQAWA